MSMPKLSEPPSKVSIPFTHMILFIPFFKLSLTHSVSFNPILPFLYSTVLWFSIYFLFFIGWGSDEKAIIAILAHRNAIQRRHIRIAYEQLFQEDLIKRLESEISGHFEVLILIFFFFFLSEKSSWSYSCSSTSSVTLYHSSFLRFSPAHCSLPFFENRSSSLFSFYVCVHRLIVVIIFTIHVWCVSIVDYRHHRCQIVSNRWLRHLLDCPPQFFRWWKDQL